MMREHEFGNIQFRPMKLDDVPEVAAIDKISFPTPWSDTTYRKELEANPAAYLFIAEARPAEKSNNEVLGYIGFWYIVDEIHISTLAVRPEYRRQGIGRMLLAFALAEAESLGALTATLEVRETNTGAIALYHTFGFKTKGRRPGYYRDTDEDAYVMEKLGPGLHQSQAREKARGF
jgi:ribosomal-protein-alanine N-acetyltransferase